MIKTGDCRYWSFYKGIHNGMLVLSVIQDEIILRLQEVLGGLVVSKFGISS